MKLQSLSDIFEKRLLRIPDYQRGYAWLEHQYNDFWEDILHLNIDRVHYTGVITLEPVPRDVWRKWENDEWIIEGVGFKPFYVVDGQQRLTTSMLLMQAILESVDASELLNYQSLETIRKQYIINRAEDGQRASFIFGYEKDNPSDEYLKTKVFGVHSHSNQYQETLYTQNLSKAKAFFMKKLSELTTDEIAVIYKKLTQKFKFNLYEIDDEIDVYVTFETMNNRGKPLTSLELLKNRLIYLSTLFKEHEGHAVLRAKINNAWKTIYEYLGKNPEAPLSEHLFLRNHWTMYFKYTRRKGDDYIKFLLDEKFTARNVTHPKKEGDRISVEEIDKYVTSLQQSIRPWFYMHNPYFPLPEYTDEQNKLLLDRLHRLSFRAFKPLLLAAYVSQQCVEKINLLLSAAERYNFTLFTLSQRRSNTGDTEFFSMSRDLMTKKITIDSIVSSITEWVDKYYDPNRFLAYISEKYELGNHGFFKWDGIRYFLYEHEQWLRSRGKQSSNKLSWEKLSANKKDSVTIEHIFPQTPKDPYWLSRFGAFSKEETQFVAHSLGNLVPLSRAKNSSLQNDSFDLKKNNGNGVGFYNGSASENELAQKEEWLPESILERGLELLKFMEERWDIVVGDNNFKTNLLHLTFLNDKEEVTI
ncbi:DUF262 domain-containing protein [Pseudoalteromonas sp. MEBiC 03485]|uniref:DUF262 domain-containing protein n=1 Tax=Pseudoalteromonas sp. MEBiC 03485 TaxID=2571103 RepID=UPI001020D502|nr:DUF262 domain-containing protein [Pseudoalteromonas sp. MEBiC 03485]RZD20080.1 DUF262 domain-containing protein [Pseudoalteromonas sp. MEBiC 03485]